MRTASIALLLSLSFTIACSSSGGEEGPALQDEAPAATPSAPSAPSAPSTPAAAPSSASEMTPAPEAAPENDDAGAPAPPASDAGSPWAPDSGVVIGVPVAFFGRIVATLPGASCIYHLDGVLQGSMSTLDVSVPLGDHEIRCDAGSGRVATALVSVSLGETESITMELPPAQPSGPGTLVAVAVGGSCTFAVNGASKGTSSQLKLSVPAGTYSVSCKPATGATKTRNVIVKPGETAMAMFKLN